MVGKYPYQKQWEDYRRIKIIALLFFLGYLPLFVIANFIFKLINIDEKISASIDINFVFFIFYGAIVMICGYRLQTWKCPNCNKSFHTKWWCNNAFSAKCLHCKFPKYEGSTFYS